MKFRTKLFYAFISLGLLSTLVALFIVYGESSRMIFKEIQSKVLSLAISSRYLISTANLESYLQSGEKNSPEGNQINKELQRILLLNQRSDIYAQRIYIIRKYAGSNRYFFVAGSESKDHSIPLSFGDAYSAPIRGRQDSSKPFVETHVYSDDRGDGSWITGYSPIFNDQGKQLGLLGIDIEAKEIYQELERLLLHGLGAFAISICVAMIFAYFLSNLVSSSLDTLCSAVKKIGEGNLSFRSNLKTEDEFNELSLAINEMAQGLEERDRLKMGFARYVSQYALDELLKLDKPISLEGERKKVTILFSDIRNFTAIAEKLPPEEVLKMLNIYFEEMIEVIFHYGGTLDKFIGDGMMVEFGAPLEDDLQELHAILSAIQMQNRLKKLSDQWEKNGRDRLQMGIGIHTGLAVIGNIGSERRMEYTAIGDTVNVASRLERMTKKVHKSIIVSQSVYEKTKEHFIFEDLKEIELPGRKGYIQAYSLDFSRQKNIDKIELDYDLRSPEKEE